MTDVTTVTQDQLTLTEEEKNIILALRKDEEKRQQQKQMMLAVLETAARYARWLEENGRGTSYTTFVDEFGFDEDIKMSRHSFYELVTSCFDAARGMW